MPALACDMAGAGAANVAHEEGPIGIRERVVNMLAPGLKKAALDKAINGAQIPPRSRDDPQFRLATLVVNVLDDLERP